jgi:hypothetical protein
MLVLGQSAQYVPTRRRSSTLRATFTVGGVGELVNEHYDACLLDQFGVLHDGSEPYAHAIAACRQLHERGKTLIVCVTVHNASQ